MIVNDKQSVRPKCGDKPVYFSLELSRAVEQRRTKNEKSSGIAHGDAALNQMFHGEPCAPLVIEVLRDQPTVTLVGFVLTAKQA